MRVTDPLALYPRAWRARYGDELSALLADRPPTAADRLDLARGALDAWLHPTRPSMVPPSAALLGGGLWTVLAVIVLLQPVPPDWPGYLIELVPMALTAVVCLGIATLGMAMRRGDAGGRSGTGAVAIATAGYIAWAAMLAGSFDGLVPAPALAAAQGAAMVGTALVGIALVRSGDGLIGGLLAVAPILVLVPSTTGWLAYGTGWTVVGIAALVGRATRSGPAGIAR